MGVYTYIYYMLQNTYINLQPGRQCFKMWNCGIKHSWKELLSSISERLEKPGVKLVINHQEGNDFAIPSKQDTLPISSAL